MAGGGAERNLKEKGRKAGGSEKEEKEEKDQRGDKRRRGRVERRAHTSCKDACTPSQPDRRVQEKQHRAGAFPEHWSQPTQSHHRPRPRGFSLNNPGSLEPEGKPGPWRKERQGWDGAQERQPLSGGKVALRP